jgi:RNA polymerase sigma-70 factor (ECF subfamily)
LDLPVTEIWARKDGIPEREAEHEKARDEVSRSEAFAALVERHARLMFRVAYALHRNAQDAEDAVQEAFLKLYRGEAWRRMQDEKAFLARTVWRVALDRVGPKAGVMTDVAEMDLESSASSPEKNAVDAQMRRRLGQLIDGLPEEMRQVLMLSAVEEMTSPAVAAVLGIPEGTVRTRLMRARSELKKRYEAGGRS